MQGVRICELGLDTGMYDALQRLVTACIDAGRGEHDWTCVAESTTTDQGASRSDPSETQTRMSGTGSPWTNSHRDRAFERATTTSSTLPGNRRTRSPTRAHHGGETARPAAHRGQTTASTAAAMKIIAR